MIKALQKSDHGEIAEDVKLELVKNYSKVMHNVGYTISIVTLLCSFNIIPYTI